jgi:hypothetical protein
MHMMEPQRTQSSQRQSKAGLSFGWNWESPHQDMRDSVAIREPLCEPCVLCGEVRHKPMHMMEPQRTQSSQSQSKAGLSFGWNWNSPHQDMRDSVAIHEPFCEPCVLCGEVRHKLVHMMKPQRTQSSQSQSKAGLSFGWNW